MAYNDPQDVHGGECAACRTWFPDNEQDLDADDVCDDCAEAGTPAVDWLAVAAGIVGVVR